MARFSSILLDHFQDPQNYGTLESPDLTGVGGVPGHGPSVVLYLKLNGNRIAEARHLSLGCGVTIAAGSMLTTMILARTIDECHRLTDSDLTTALGGVPPDKLHSPRLAIAALQAALSAHHSPSDQA